MSEQFNPAPIQEGVMHGPYPTKAMQLEQLREEHPLRPQLAAEPTPTEEALHQLSRHSRAVSDAKFGIPTSGEYGAGVKKVSEITPEAAVELGAAIVKAREQVLDNESNEDYLVRKDREHLNRFAGRHERNRRLQYGGGKAA